MLEVELVHGVEVLAGTRERLWVAWRGGLDLREAAESVGVSWEAARRWLAACGGVVPPPSPAAGPAGWSVPGVDGRGARDDRVVAGRGAQPQRGRSSDRA